MNWQVENRTESGRNSSSQPALATTVQDQPKVLKTEFLILAMSDAGASFFSNYYSFFNQVGYNQEHQGRALLERWPGLSFFFDEIGTNMVHKLLDEEEMWSRKLHEQRGGENPALEELRAAKEAIAQATPDCADPNLHTNLYKNVTAFSK